MKDFDNKKMKILVVGMGKQHTCCSFISRWLMDAGNKNIVIDCNDGCDTLLKSQSLMEIFSNSNRKAKYGKKNNRKLHSVKAYYSN